MIFSHKGVLGINARNFLYIKPYNKDKTILFADDKLQTKRFLETRHIPVPKLLGTIASFQELKQYPFQQLPARFVVKPNTGYGGNGIIVFSEHARGSHVVTGNGEVYSYTQLRDHVSDILDGQFSLNEKRDIAFFEERLQTHKFLQPYAYRGLPDIRIIVFNLIPVMAMLRLPTKESEGKANLHQGAIGCGIDIGKGEITYMSYKNKIIDQLPEGGVLKGLRLPYWNDILLIASKIQYITSLGYLAVDIALDEKRGPVLLEINARAGLNIQVANQAPLQTRLARVKGIKVGTPEKGVRLAQELFGKTIQKDIEHLSGKTVIGEEEMIEILTEQTPLIAKAKISTISPKSYMDAALFDTMIRKIKSAFAQKRFFPCKLVVEGKKISVIMHPRKWKDTSYQVLLGKDALSHFIIDPYKYDPRELDDLIGKKKSLQVASAHQVIDPRLYKTDSFLADIDRTIEFLFLMKPVNAEVEKRRFLEREGKYNPLFSYRDIPFQIAEVFSQLQNCYTDNSTFGILLEQKKQEYLLKLQIVQERQHNQQITTLSQQLYHVQMESLLVSAHAILRQKFMRDHKKAEYTAEDIRKAFEQKLQEKNMTHWKVRITPALASRIAVGKQRAIKIRSDIRYTKQELEATLRHEIETHIFRAENAKLQPYKIFQYGTAGYLETEEGLAMYLLTHIEPHYPRSIQKAALHIMSLSYALHHSFRETAAYLQDITSLSPEDIFDEVLRQKRGLGDTALPGGFYKDALYLQGYNKVREFVQAGGNIQHLFHGKITVNDVSHILQLPNVKSPKYLPHSI